MRVILLFQPILRQCGKRQFNQLRHLDGQTLTFTGNRKLGQITGRYGVHNLFTCVETGKILVEPVEKLVSKILTVIVLNKIL